MIRCSGCVVLNELANREGSVVVVLGGVLGKDLEEPLPWCVVLGWFWAWTVFGPGNQESQMSSMVGKDGVKSCSRGR